MEVDGCVDAEDIAEKFAAYFTRCYSHNSINQSEAVRDEYVKLRRKCSGRLLDVFFWYWIGQQDNNGP